MQAVPHGDIVMARPSPSHVMPLACRSRRGKRADGGPDRLPTGFDAGRRSRSYGAASASTLTRADQHIISSSQALTSRLYGLPCLPLLSRTLWPGSAPQWLAPGIERSGS